MNFYDRKLREAQMEKAALMPRLAEGEKLQLPKLEIRLRPSGYWALFVDGIYEQTTSEKEEADAKRWLEIWKLQRDAEADGIYDIRRADALAIVEHRKKQVAKQKLASAGVITSTLTAIEPFLEGRQLRHLTDEWVEETEDCMTEGGYSYEYFCNGIRFLRTAIRQYTKKRYGTIFLPFDAPPSAPGRQRVISAAERNIAMRWAKGREDYDPKTKIWTKPRNDIDDTELRDRQLVYRELYLGYIFGSRPGIYDKLSWQHHDEGGWMDVDGGVFHRVPPGAPTHANKRAPAVDMPPEVIDELRRWRREDDGNPWLFRTVVGGGPLGREQQNAIFSTRLAALGIQDVTGHVLRHSCITRMVEKGLSAAIISAVCGISIKMLHSRYDHHEDRAVQPLAHGAMATMFT
ncbi:tyrosine-type recombinase/integrase [Bradyrhizobium sp. USDA 4353]